MVKDGNGKVGDYEAEESFAFNECECRCEKISENLKYSDID